jgi:hypothetical protein
LILCHYQNSGVPRGQNQVVYVQDANQYPHS